MYWALSATERETESEYFVPRALIASPHVATKTFSDTLLCVLAAEMSIRCLHISGDRGRDMSP